MQAALTRFDDGYSLPYDLYRVECVWRPALHPALPALLLQLAGHAPVRLPLARPETRPGIFCCLAGPLRPSKKVPKVSRPLMIYVVGGGW